MNLYTCSTWDDICVSIGDHLTHWGLNEMAAIQQISFSKAFSWLKISALWLKLVNDGTVDNTSAWLEAMAWCQTGNKPLPQPMMIQFMDTYMLAGLNELMADKKKHNPNMVLSWQLLQNMFWCLSFKKKSVRNVNVRWQWSLTLCNLLFHWKWDIGR